MKPFEKVVLYGVNSGMELCTIGESNILVTLENGEKVAIPEYLTKSADKIIDKDNIKLKDVIARIKKLDLDTQKVWLNEILNKLGSDYGTLKYKAGYEQGKFEGSLIPYDEPQKVTVPQFVTNFITEQKKLGHTLSYSIDACMSDIVAEWYWDNSELFARAWIFGYEVEEEKRYTVVTKATKQPLYYNAMDKKLFFSMGGLATKFTRKQLEEAGLGWVFDCEGVEVEEVE